MSIMKKKSNANNIFILFSRKAKELNENTKNNGDIDIFHELFRINMKGFTSSFKGESLL